MIPACPDCGKKNTNETLTTVNYYVADKELVIVWLESLIPPKDAKFMDMHYCSCGRLIKYNFRK